MLYQMNLFFLVLRQFFRRNKPASPLKINSDRNKCRSLNNPQPKKLWSKPRGSWFVRSWREEQTRKRIIQLRRKRL